MPPPSAARPGFSQANKLCFRARPAQSTWLAEHIATTERQISDVMRDALDLYIAAHAILDGVGAVVGELPAASVPAAVRPSAPSGLRLASLR